MKIRSVFLLISLLLSQWLMACQDIELARRSRQEVHIGDFSENHIFELDATRDRIVSKLLVTVDGAVSDSITLQFDYLDQTGIWTSFQKIPLPKGSYSSTSFHNDFYSSAKLRMTVVAPPTTTGQLIINWGT